MNHSELIERRKRDEQQPFIRWDFSYLDIRMIEAQTLWSFSVRAAKLLQQSFSVVDLGTGGGERFVNLREYWPNEVLATEDYPPNFKLARERYPPSVPWLYMCKQPMMS